MIKLRPYVPSKRIAIRDSSIDEDASDDVEDEVFIKDARSAKVSYQQFGLENNLLTGCEVLEHPFLHLLGAIV